MEFHEIIVTKKKKVYYTFCFPHLVYGIQYLFLEPNPDDPLNKEAANELQQNRKTFEQNVERTIRGQNLNGVQYEKCSRK